MVSSVSVVDYRWDKILFHNILKVLRVMLLDTVYCYTRVTK